MARNDVLKGRSLVDVLERPEQGKIGNRRHASAAPSYARHRP